MTYICLSLRDWIYIDRPRLDRYRYLNINGFVSKFWSNLVATPTFTLSDFMWSGLEDCADNPQKRIIFP